MKHKIYVLLCVYALHLFSAEKALLDLPRDIQNQIALYLLWEDPHKTLHNMGRCLGYPTSYINDLFYADIGLHLDNGNLLLSKQRGNTKEEAALFMVEKPTVSFGNMLLDARAEMNSIYKNKNKVVKAHVSPNGKFVGFLVASCNDITENFQPVSIHVVNIEKNMYEEILILDKKIAWIEEIWKKNRVNIEKNNAITRNKLEEEGYRWRGDWLSIDGAGTYMTNDIISLAVDNNGRNVAIADQTGIMIINMKEKTIQKVVSKNWSLFSSLSTIKAQKPFQMCFDHFSMKLFYTSDQTTDTINIVELQKFDNNTNNLKKCFKFMGVLSPNSSLDRAAFWKDRIYRYRNDM